MLNVLEHSIDSEFGRWTLARWEPEPGSPLRGLVRGVWDFEGMVNPRHERVFPNGGVELLLQLDDRYRDILETGAVENPRTCVTGVHSHAFVIEAPPRPCRVIGIGLEPPAAWALLDQPLSELADATVDLEEVLGRPVAELAERCHGMDSGSGRVRCVAGWLAVRLLLDGRAERAIDPSIRHVAESIAGTGGRVTIGRLREHTGLPHARLTEGFRRQVGVTPKRYARIHRFQRAVALLNEPDPRLAEIALSAGYYDQPHMNAEFRRLAGMTPGTYLHSRRFPESTHLAEPART